MTFNQPNRLGNAVLVERLLKTGKQQVFAACELLAVSSQLEQLVATGEALLSVAQRDS